MAQVGIIMGSDSDMPVMKEAISILEGFDIQFEVDIVSCWVWRSISIRSKLCFYMLQYYFHG